MEKDFSSFFHKIATISQFLVRKTTWFVILHMAAISEDTYRECVSAAPKKKSAGQRRKQTSVLFLIIHLPQSFYRSVVLISPRI